MHAAVAKAIEESHAAVHLRQGDIPESLELPADLPLAIREFVQAVSSGILFPAPASPGRDPHGFEVLDSTLLWSINHLLGDPPLPDRDGDYFDRCHVLFSAVDDQCLLIGVDLNVDRHGWIFLSDLNPGNGPYESSEYQARSFTEWLEIHLRQGSGRHPAETLPSLGNVGSIAL